ncbi:MAG: polysaccharide deacetylase family protein [Solirubrobacteraceae bacterium]
MARELTLTFHGLGEPPDSIGAAERNVWVALEWFEAILDAPLGDGVGLAFDDGNASDVQLALPALTRRNVTARFFPLTGRIDVAGYLSAADIAELSAAGMAIGSHGHDHSDWRRLGDDELREELTSSRQTLTEIVGTDVTEAACPFGSYDRRVLRALRAAGYRRAFTSDGGTDATGAWPSARTTVDRHRPLQYWLELARAGAQRPPGPVQLGKRLVKRVR